MNLDRAAGAPHFPSFVRTVAGELRADLERAGLDAAAAEVHEDLPELRAALHHLFANERGSRYGQASALDRLAPEVLEQVFSFMTAQELGRFDSTCPHARAAQPLWQLRQLKQSYSFNRVGGDIFDVDALLQSAARHGLPHLTHVALKDLTTAIAQRLAKLAPQLQVLGSEFVNSFDEAGLRAICGMTALRDLQLPLPHGWRDEQLAPLSELVSLQTLELRAPLGAGCLRYVTSNIRALRIGYVRIDDLRVLQRMERLVSLDLNSNLRLRSDDALASLAGLPIERLDLSSVQIDPRGLSGLPRLRHLAVRNTRLQDATVLQFPLTLESLDMATTRVTDAVLPFIGALPNLRQLDIISCDALTRDAVLKLARARPRLEIRSEHLQPPRARPQTGFQRIAPTVLRNVGV